MAPAANKKMSAEAAASILQPVEAQLKASIHARPHGHTSAPHIRSRRAESNALAEKWGQVPRGQEPHSRRRDGPVVLVVLQQPLTGPLQVWCSVYCAVGVQEDLSPELRTALPMLSTWLHTAPSACSALSLMLSVSTGDMLYRPSETFAWPHACS